jgi:hypothetical protein
MSRDERIAARLMAALVPLMPASCTTSIQAGWLAVAIDGHWWVSVCVGIDDRLPDREAVMAANVLNTIQDAIVRWSTRPWPPASEPTYLPCPDAAVRQGQLVIWFGPEDNPTVTLPPIDLATV